MTIAKSTCTNPGRVGPAAQILSVVLLLSAILPVAAQTQTTGKANPEDVDSLDLVTVIGITPLTGTDISAQKLPYASQSANDDSLRRAQAVDVSDFMNRNLAGVTLNQAQGNPLQPDLQFRGFTATPLLGGSEGVSVYVDGVRVNEVFGDTVNWDLIPEDAIERMSLLSGANPIFGLNTLGGAVSIQTKTGFSDPGTRGEYYGGSFGRRQSMIESGGHAGQWGWYVMGNYFDEDGWRDLSPSRAANLYGTLSWRGDNASLDLHAGRGNTNLVGNGAAPVEELAQHYSGIFTAPDQTANAMTVVSLQGSVSFTKTRKLAFNVYHRVVNTMSYNGDTTDAEACDEDDDILCDEDGNPELDQNGDPISSDNNAINNISHRHQRADGGTVQFVVSDPLGSMQNQFVVGAEYLRGRLRFDSAVEASSLQDNLQTVANTGIFIPDQALNVGTDSNTTGLFATDTLSLTPQLALTLSGRWNQTHTNIQDLSGDNPDLDGRHSFSRFNPAAGLAYQLTPTVNIYGGYSESTRAPTPVELTCADDDAPCKLPNQFLADPDLKQVVAKSWELGVRGALSSGGGDRTTWHAGLFRTTNTNDILFQVTGGASSNEGFFANVGDTRRQGVELTLDGTLFAKSLHWYVNYTYLDATYLSSFLEVSANHPDADENGIISVQKGDHIPSLPKNSFKIGADYTLWGRLSIGGDVINNSSQYLRTDEANLLGQISGYTVVNLRAVYTINSHFSIFGRIDNVFDRRYYTFGVLGDATDVFPDFENPRFLSPAQPRGAWVGLRVAL